MVVLLLVGVCGGCGGDGGGVPRMFPVCPRMFMYLCRGYGQPCYTEDMVLPHLFMEDYIYKERERYIYILIYVCSSISNELVIYLSTCSYIRGMAHIF